MDKRINFINNVMKAVNNDVDDIYESLIDEEYYDCEQKIDSLIEILLDIKKTFKEEL